MKYIPAAILASAATITIILFSVWMLWFNTSTSQEPSFLSIATQITFALFAVWAGAFILFFGIAITVALTDEETEELDK